MILPRNGRVVVVDDEIEEALPLIKALSKNGTSVSYFSGLRNKELPSVPFNDVRIVFLDIVIGTKQSPKNQISTIGGILKKIIGEKSIPYILIGWTKHSELLEEIKSIPGLSPPIICLDLDKIDCKKDDGNYDTDKIQSRIKKELKKAGFLHLFMLWENIVHNSANQIINEFTSFYDNSEQWDENLSNVLYHLAEAYAGKQLRSNNKDIIQNSLLTFNGTFLDSLENSIRNLSPRGINFTSNPQRKISKEILAKINSKLHLIDFEETDVAKLHPGNVYAIEEGDKKAIDINDLYNGALDNSPKKNELLSKIKFLIVEVTPSCDFAQDNWKMNRLLSGVIWPEDFSNKIKKDAEFIYKSPLFEKDGNLFRLVFNYRYLTNMALTTLKKKKPIFRIKHNFLIDVQSRLANHISRPGIVFLNELRKL